jgi:hypothetical protein
MSRSRRHTPIFGITTGDSEKQDKRQANRLLRRQVRLAMEARKEVLPHLREVSNVWCFAKDGKSWWANPTARHMRK